MNDTLSIDDLHDITGARQTAKQAEILLKAGIYFWYRMDGTICTTWHHVHNPTTIQHSTPDYSAIDGKKTA